MGAAGGIDRRRLGPSGDSPRLVGNQRSGLGPVDRGPDPARRQRIELPVDDLHPSVGVQ